MPAIQTAVLWSRAVRFIVGPPNVRRRRRLQIPARFRAKASLVLFTGLQHSGGGLVSELRLTDRRRFVAVRQMPPTWRQGKVIITLPK
jgi:hypothetical protein